MAYTHDHVVGIILTDSQGRVALHRRIGTVNFNNYYCLPAGSVDLGESVLQAAARELREELSLVVPAEDLKLICVVERPSTLASSNGHYVMESIFHLDAWKGELVNNEPEKHDDIEWFSPNALPRPMHPSMEMAIGVLARGEGFRYLQADGHKEAV